MKITKRQLRRIIKEEKAKLQEGHAEYGGGHSLLDLEDYEMLEDTVTVAIRNLVRAGYTREDVAQALQTIAMDA